ncbi:hypothetical protein IEQ34_016903 [Dendrobium chrysotoxum]|uniref:Uncharacterized protein n=1 Tax=Dendrobium chrysotoxum TaxID=161865 RepID=A0AAV7FZH1_DENCH|nr:hypothetical protein IEQ34_016903 [Dendrobium chrysotoxum]
MNNLALRRNVGERELYCKGITISKQPAFQYRERGPERDEADGLLTKELGLRLDKCEKSRSKSVAIKGGELEDRGEERGGEESPSIEEEACETKATSVHRKP